MQPSSPRTPSPPQTAPSFPPLPAELTPLVCSHISLRERGTLHSLLLVNKDFAAFMPPYLKAAAISRQLGQVIENHAGDIRLRDQFRDCMKSLKGQYPDSGWQFLAVACACLQDGHRARSLRADDLTSCLMVVLQMVDELPDLPSSDQLRREREDLVFMLLRFASEISRTGGLRHAWDLKRLLQSVAAKLFAVATEQEWERIFSALSAPDSIEHARLVCVLLAEVAVSKGVDDVLLGFAVRLHSRLPKEPREKHLVPLLAALLKQGKFQGKRQIWMPPEPDPEIARSDRERLDDYWRRCATVMKVVGELSDAKAAALLSELNMSWWTSMHHAPPLECAPASRALELDRKDCFFTLALPQIRRLPPKLRAQVIAEWDFGSYTRIEDDKGSRLVDLLRDCVIKVPEALLIKALCNTTRYTVTGHFCSPLRARQALAQLFGFPARVRAGVLMQAFSGSRETDSCYDVRFQCLVEAAQHLPDEERAQVLGGAARNLTWLPYRHEEKAGSAAFRDASLQARERAAFRHFGLDAPDADATWRALVQPGFVPIKELYALVLQAASSLPAMLRAPILRMLCDERHYWRFTNTNALDAAERKVLKRQLLDAMLDLPQEHRIALLPGFMRVLEYAEFDESHLAAMRRDVFLRILALPESEAAPLLESWIGKQYDTWAQELRRQVEQLRAERRQQ